MDERTKRKLVEMPVDTVRIGELGQFAQQCALEGCKIISTAFNYGFLMGQRSQKEGVDE